jgi:hypothetical protein
MTGVRKLLAGGQPIGHSSLLLSYRAALCAFCDESAIEPRPRCQVLVCASHGLAGHAFCAICRKERDEELELPRFAEDVHEEGSTFVVTPQSRAIESMIGEFSRAVHDLFDPPPYRTSFDQRTPSESATWRKSAGIKLRS